MTARKRYSFFDHTADIGMSIFGNDLKELLTNAASGMFEILGDGGKFEGKEKRVVKVDEVMDVEELMHKWLAELLYIFETDRLFLTKFNLNEIDEKHLKGEVEGESYVGKEKFLRKEIKAVTYHQMIVKKHKNVWRGNIIFDI